MPRSPRSRPRRAVAAVSFALLAALGATGAMAQAAGQAPVQTAADKAATERLYMRSQAATCAHCHGMNGHGVPNGLPDLGGRPRDELITLLNEFRAGTRKSTIMTQITKGYTEDQLKALAGWFAAQPPANR